MRFLAISAIAILSKNKVVVSQYYTIQAFDSIELSANQGIGIGLLKTQTPIGYQFACACNIFLCELLRVWVVIYKSLQGSSSS